MAALVSASAAVPMTFSASGAQNELCSEGSGVPSVCAWSQAACGTPPTQKISACTSGEPARYYSLKSSPTVEACTALTRSCPKRAVNCSIKELVSSGELYVAGV